MQSLLGMKVFALCAVLLAAPALAVNEVVEVKGPLVLEESP